MGVPLLTAHDASGHVHLIAGSNPVANARCSKSLEAGARVVVFATEGAHVHHALQSKVDEEKVVLRRGDLQDGDLQQLGRAEVDGVVDAVFITMGGEDARSKHIASLCRRLRIPVNVADAPDLCTFTLLSTHSDGPLHIGITTSGMGCKLASRIRREVASSIPPKFGEAVERLGSMRRRIWEEDRRRQAELPDLAADQSDDDASAQKSNFNQLITETNEHAQKSRRIRWLSQICEYWPLRRLASITDAEIDSMLQSYCEEESTSADAEVSLRNGHKSPVQSKARVILAGSGPGSPHLLTLATHRAIQSASLILADKLVPAAVMDLIPRRTPVHIARKFPGNADAGQQELLQLGLAALRRGSSVLRLKQGDPYIFGRGGEEYAFFRAHGYTPVVLPGITSALSAPVFAAIPPTHRSVADQVLICTGTGRKGAAPAPPPYVETQTVVFLMALHRLESLVGSLTGKRWAVIDGGGAEEDIANKNNDKGEVGGENDNSPSDPRPISSPPWPPTTPCAVLERASCPDQRVIRSTLQHVVAAVEEQGSRPPGLLVVGHCCEVLVKGVEGVGYREGEEEGEGEGEKGVKAKAKAKWAVEEGFVAIEEFMSESAGLGFELNVKPNLNLNLEADVKEEDDS